jgi:hypothetical protein
LAREETGSFDEKREAFDHKSEATTQVNVQRITV